MVKPKTFRCFSGDGTRDNPRLTSLLGGFFRHAAAKEITQTDAKRSGNTDKRIEGNCLHAPLDGTEVDRVQISFLSQSFLAHASALASRANVVAQHAAVFRDWTHLLTQKENP